jgi:hypothetical protein
MIGIVSGISHLNISYLNIMGNSGRRGSSRVLKSDMSVVRRNVRRSITQKTCYQPTPEINSAVTLLARATQVIRTSFLQTIQSSTLVRPRPRARLGNNHIPRANFFVDFQHQLVCSANIIHNAISCGGVVQRCSYPDCGTNQR